MKNAILTTVIFVISSLTVKAQLDTVNYDHWFLELESSEISLDSTNTIEIDIKVKFFDTTYPGHCNFVPLSTAA